MIFFGKRKHKKIGSKDIRKTMRNEKMAYLFYFCNITLKFELIVILMKFRLNRQ